LVISGLLIYTFYGTEQASQTTMEIASNDTQDISNLLPWLVDMGADEVLLDATVNRFAVQVDEPKEVRSVLQRAIVQPQRPKTNWAAIAAGAEGVAAAQNIANSIATLADYPDAVASFEAHPLKKTASRACALSGLEQASVLLLCDRPRNEEDRSGDVLAGNHVILATRMMAAIDLSFENDVAVANFIPWRPPGNRAPTEQEAQMMVPLLQKLIALLKPKAILCFGHLPGQYLAGGEDAPMKARGKVLSINGIPLLTTFHPETLLKSPQSKRMAWHDLQAFRQILDQQ
jgi:uracil-DNA glycosylase family 4